jgi:hypothetical protein
VKEYARKEKASSYDSRKEQAMGNRDKRAREEKGKESGNQAIEHTDKTKARIQTYLTTTTATAVSNR